MSAHKINLKTLRGVQSALKQLDPEKADQFLWHTGDLPGFGIRCGMNGRVQFVYQYRMSKGGRARRITLGRFPSTFPRFRRILRVLPLFVRPTGKGFSRAIASPPLPVRRPALRSRRSGSRSRRRSSWPESRKRAG